MFGMFGTVYILENAEAKLVKVGVTINNPNDRLIDVNRMWLGIKGICQVCGNRRLLNARGLMPKHVLSMRHCTGSEAPPIEKDITLAEQELNKYKQHKINSSSARRIQSLEKLINAYRDAPLRVGVWTLHSAFKTNNAYVVESIAHEHLDKYLEKSAPFGEVFSCSAQEAKEAVEGILNRRF
jgi:hypothetical protein